MAAGIVRSPDPIVISKRVVNMDMLLKGKRALITGSTSGIGAQCARVLAGEGVSVVINGRNADRAAAVTEEIRKVGGEAKFVLGDVTTEDGSNAVIERAKSAFDGIDILVNNLGNPTQESHHSWFDAPFQSWIADYHQNAKAAINNVTLSLSKELAGTGVTSNGIMPGLIYTPQLDKVFIETAQRQGSDDPEFGKQYVLKNIVHQTVSRLGQPMDIAAAVCFLASPLTDFMTGTTFRIDGGSTPTV